MGARRQLVTAAAALLAFLLALAPASGGERASLAAAGPMAALRRCTALGATDGQLDACLLAPDTPAALAALAGDLTAGTCCPLPPVDGAAADCSVGRCRCW